MRELFKFLISYCTALLAQLGKTLIVRIQSVTSDPVSFQTLGLWTAAVLAAFASVLYAKFFRFAELKFFYVINSYKYSGFLLTPLFFILAWWVVRRFAPEAGGSGIPQIMAADEIDYENLENRPKVDRLLSLRTAGVKVLSSLLCVFGGGAIGREGPTLQISATIFHFVGCQVRRWAPNISEHTWVVAGAAAGLASAFNTPLGGIVYAIEELGMVHFHRVRTALISGVIVSGLVAQWVLGSYLYLGYPVVGTVSFSILPAALVTGLVTGVAGALFGRLLIALVNKRLAIRSSWRLAAIAGLLGVVVAGLTFIDSRAAGPGGEVINGLLFSQAEPSYEISVIRFIGTMATYLSGAAGGIFSPSLAIGAALGGNLSRFFTEAQPSLMVLLGMIGFLTGVTRTPFTSFILVLEMTDRHSAIFPMMLVAVAAQSIAPLIDPHSFYEYMKRKYMGIERQETKS